MRTELMIPWSQIEQAILAIQGGWSKRVDVTDGVKVYAVQNVIRIDIKGVLK